MKKLFSLIAILSLLTACTTDVKFSDPGFQAYRNNTLFRGVDVKAYKDSSGHITLIALADNETVEFDIESSNLGTYYMGTSNLDNSVTYTTLFDGYNLLYRTDVIAGPVAKIERPMVSGGSGYGASNGLPTTGGSGSGLTVKTTVQGDVVTSATVATPGNGYKAGELITINSGGQNAKFRILNVEGSNGELIITDNSGGTLTGTFKFNAPKISTATVGDALVNFTNGAFYKIPILPAP